VRAYDNLAKANDKAKRKNIKLEGKSGRTIATAMTVSEDVLYIGYDDGMIVGYTVSNMLTKAVTCVDKSNTTPIWGVCVSDRFIFSVSEVCDVKKWNKKKGAAVGSFKGHTRPPKVKKP
jgi:hypothetical protein